MADTEIRHSITIAAPIDAVWAEITKVGTRQRAQLDSVLDTSFVPGDPLYYRPRTARASSWSAGSSRAIRRRTFSHTQVLTMRDDPLTVVTWTSSPFLRAPG